MTPIDSTNLCAIATAAALDTKFVEQALSNVASGELVRINEDIVDVEFGLPRSTRLVEIMQRARLISDADAMLARLEAG